MEPLEKCTNPIKILKLGKFYFGFQWANKGLWENDIYSMRERYYFKLYKCYDDKRSGIGLVIFKVSMHFSKKKGETK